MEKKIKIIILLLVILVVAGVATHLFLSPSTVESKESKNVTDMINRSVEIPVSVSNVVATSPPMTTVLYMIAPDKLKAVNFQWTDDELKYVPNQYQNYPVVGGWYGSQDGSYEEFIASEPDIVIESIDEGGDGDLSTVKERQDKFGKIPVVAVNDTTNVEKIEKSSMTLTINIWIWFMINHLNYLITIKKRFIMLKVMMVFKPILHIQPMGN